MNPIARFLVVTGVVLLVLGLLWHVGSKYLNLGQLPGDINIEGKNFRFYFPIVTCIVLSIVLSVLISLFHLFRR